MDLALDDQRVDDSSEIVGSGEIQQGDRPGIAIDLDLGDMRACRVGEVRRIVKGRLVESRLDRIDRIIVRHIGGQSDLGERYGPVGTRDGELASLELDVGLGRFEQVGGNLLSLAHHFVDRLDESRAADRERARGVGAHAKRDLVRVAVDDVDHLDGYAELTGYHLCKGRLVALAMAVCAGEYGDASGRMNTNLCRLVETGACTELAGEHRRRHCASLDICGDTNAAELAMSGRFLTALLEPGIISSLQRHIEGGEIVAAVISKRDRRLIRVGVTRDEVAAAQLGRIDPHLTRSRIDETLDNVACFGPPGAAIGIYRHSVGEYPLDLDVDGRGRVRPS